MKTNSRRQFVSGLAVPAAAALALPSTFPLTSHAIEPITRAGEARLRLSLAAYSLRQFFKDQPRNAKPADASKAIDLFDFVDFCGKNGCDAAELTAYYFPSDAGLDYCVRLRRHAFMQGLTVSGSAVGNTFTLPVGEKRTEQIEMVKQWIERTAALGASHLRVFAGDTPTGISKSQARALCVTALEECCVHAAKHGVLLGLENHGGIVAEPADLLEIVKSIKSPWFGVNLDTGNFHTADPYADLERCLPYAVNVQVKVEIQPRDQPKVAADLGRLVKMLRDGRYQGYVALEYEAAEDPWTAIPRHLQALNALLRG